MEYLSITGLKMGTLLLDKMFDGVPVVVPTRQPVWAAAISGGKKKILVDTGLHDERWITENCITCIIEPDETMIAALSRIGWTPDEVDIVVNTHLHYDHVGNNRLFKNAVFYTGRQEYKAAFHPPQSQAFLYERTRQLYDVRAVRPEQWRFVDDPIELIPGVRLLPTPGHTDGHISAFVQTQEGVVCIAGDAVMFMENFELGYVNKLFTCRTACLSTYDIIRRFADRVFPGHSQRIEKFQNSDFPIIPKKI